MLNKLRHCGQIPRTTSSKLRQYEFVVQLVQWDTITWPFVPEWNDVLDSSRISRTCLVQMKCLCCSDYGACLFTNSEVLQQMMGFPLYKHSNHWATRNKADMGEALITSACISKVYLNHNAGHCWLPWRSPYRSPWRYPFGTLYTNMSLTSCPSHFPCTVLIYP